MKPLLLIAVLAVVVVGSDVINAVHTDHHTCTVTDKDRTSDHNDKSDARVYTEDCGTFQVADSYLSWTFSSADTYATIEPGHTYEFTTRGYRIPFLSAFPNIVEAKETP